MSKMTRSKSGGLEKQKSGDIPSEPKVRLSFTELKTLAEGEFNNQNYEASINWFCKLIKYQDPELIVLKFIKLGLEKYLPTYLMKCHWKGKATVHLTQLLISILAKYKEDEKISNFVTIVNTAQKVNNGTINEADDPKWNIYKKLYPTLSIDTIIDMLNQCGYQSEASKIRANIVISDYEIQSLISEKKLYLEAATRIHNANNDLNGKSLLMKYGPTLINADSASGHIISQTASIFYRRDQKSDGLEYVKLLWGRPQYLMQFLKDIIADRPTPQLVTLYLELIIPAQHNKSVFGVDNIGNEMSALNIIKNPDMQFNEEQILSVCAEYRFTMGVLYLLSRKRQFHDAVQFALHNRIDDRKFIDWCLLDSTTISAQDWNELFTLYISEQKYHSLKDFDTYIPFIQKAMRFTLRTRNVDYVFMILSQNSYLPIEILDKVTASMLSTLYKSNKKLDVDKNTLKQQLEHIKIPNVVSFQPICAVCKKAISYPCALFRCGHAIHQTCFKFDQTTCPVCTKIENPVDISNTFDLLSENDHAARIISTTTFKSSK